MSRHNTGFWITCVTLLLALAGCAHSRPAVDSISSVGSDEVMVVGRIDLSPALTAEDQNLRGLTTGYYRNKVFVLTSEDWHDSDPSAGVESGDEYIEASLGETFYIKGSDKPFYFLTEVIYTTVLSDGTLRHVNLPGGVKIDIHKGDKAVYIGNLHFTRNEYFDITKVQLVDDYDRANAAFKKKFGVKYNLRKALVVPIKAKSEG